MLWVIPKQQHLLIIVIKQPLIQVLLGLLAVGMTSDPSYGQTTPNQPVSKEDYRDHALKQPGDSARGKELFHSPERLACSQCHTVDGSGQLAGPDLMDIGDVFSVEDLIQAVLEPSASIAIGFANVSIVTTNGEELTGTLKDISADSTVLIGADGKRIDIPKTTITEQRSSNISLMPEGLHAGLSLEAFSDLIAYLTSLKLPQNKQTIRRGMPSEIPVLPTPVRLEPFISEELRFPHAFVKKPGDVRFGLTWFEAIPGIRDHYLVASQSGELWLLEKNPKGDSKTLFADFSDELFYERGPNGLLGLTFHPNFTENKKYYLKHQVYENDNIVTIVVEKEAGADFKSDSGKSSRRLIQMGSSTQNHTGGCIQFGPDGYLYIGMGDTGPQRDPLGHGQNMGTRLGKIMRIDVDHRTGDLPYAIPSDNPFLCRKCALPEIWALGFREPWRFSFDSLTGDMWVGDVGQDKVEEVAIVRRGENHGWNVMEGFEGFSDQYRKSGETYTPPVFAYQRKYGNSITGGHVYRGDKQSPHYGMYICGDYTSRRIWAIRQTDRKLESVIQIATSPQGIASFGIDHTGNIYVVGYEGMIYRLNLE